MSLLSFSIETSHRPSSVFQNVKDRLRFNLIYSLASFSLTFPLRSRVHSLRLFSDSSAILNCYTCCSYPFSTVGRHFRRYWVLLLLF
ncbi:hypothetical protein MtrunA17_Chr5g0431551 [Medicago truncatula]|uniref:Uncharacterized protein n=1 Tax=Medicago truncatula TaxID=3880 RepID=A0A396HVQ8_MEDTR|nr:hypothetical protein MtrunA17_Chr5g0431551 [Medicago truncatula]